MEAKERSFTFIANDDYYDVPFFQRAYVWDEENWEELLENFFDNSESHFLGSVILKQLQTKAGDRSRYLIIDGQQRLTTLSVLLRACFDRMMENRNEYSNVEESLINTLEKMLFLSPDPFSPEKDVKIRHSHLDAKDYSSVIKGEYVELTKENEDDGQIVKCYKYFRNNLKNKDEEEIKTLWRLLTTDRSPFIVNINLGVEEDEQKIFDTVNSSGVRLSSADTIKNSLYQKYIELLRMNDEKDFELKASQYYNLTWNKAFEYDVETRDYWETLKRTGRISNDNLEILLYSYAVINGFFNPAVNNRDRLPHRYKEYIKDLNFNELKIFIDNLVYYAEVYKEFFNNFEEGQSYSFSNDELRLLHICNYLEVSTFYPYILKKLFDSKKLSIDTKEDLFVLEKYIILKSICKGSTKNFNNECVQLIENRKTPQELLDTSDDINKIAFENGLKNMKINKLPTVLLFWVELFDRNNDYADRDSLEYRYSLEHIMPQKWENNWPINNPCVYNEHNEEVTDEKEAREIRSQAVYKIGNMTLIGTKLNASLSNNTFEKKVNGDAKNKKCLKNLADLYLTRSIIEEHTWDERNINKRTNELIQKIKDVWNISFNETEIKTETIEENWSEVLDTIIQNNDNPLDAEKEIDDLNVNEKIKEKMHLEHCDNIVNCCSMFFEGFDFDGGATLGREERMVLKRTANKYDECYYKAYLAMFDRDEETCINNLSLHYNEVIYKNEEKLDEYDFYDLYLLPFKNAFPDFYSRLKLIFDKDNTEPIVFDLCNALQEYYSYNFDDYNSKILSMEKVLSKYPDSDLVHILVGTKYSDLKDWKKVIEHLTSVKTTDYWRLCFPPQMYFEIAWSYSRIKDGKNSVKYYKKCLEEAPEMEYARNNMAWEYYKLKDYNNALKEYQKCIDEKIDLRYAANGYARTLIALNMKEELIKYIKNPPKKLNKDIMTRINNYLSGTEITEDDIDDDLSVSE